MIQRYPFLGLFLACTSPAACSSASHTDDGTTPETDEDTTPEEDVTSTETEWVVPTSPEEFPPPPDGYVRLEAPVIRDLPPGQDVEECQYIRAPFEQDLDVLDVRGYQTRGGHHAVVLASLNDEPVGTSRPCTDVDNENVGAFLGGPNGDTGDSLPLPEGASFRVRQGQTIMLNTHFINTLNEPVDGHTVIDIKFADVDDTRTIATLFPVGGMQFEVPPNGSGEFSAGCELPERMELVGISNHMHDWGDTAITEVVRADGEVIVLRDDPAWSYEMQFAAEWDFWSVEDPFIIEPGDTIRTSCTWQNTTGEPLAYPREMCFGRAYVLSSDSQMPVCFDGSFFKY